LDWRRPDSTLSSTWQVYYDVKRYDLRFLNTWNRRITQNTHSLCHSGYNPLKQKPFYSCPTQHLHVVFFVTDEETWNQVRRQRNKEPT
jgi:hypothetical protein